ncbi:10529_t:CDS:2, partial [Gigaspora margarita]
ELSCDVGQIKAALLNVTFGNAVELIIAIIALVKGQIRIVQSSLLGSIFLNILLVLGSCILAGTIKILKNRQLEQEFSSTAVQANLSMMTLACIALIVPTAYSLLINNSISNHTVNMNDPRVLSISYRTSIILILKTHKDLFKNEEDKDSQISKFMAIFLLIIVTVLTAVLFEFLVSSIEGVVISLGLSKTFIGLILIPIIRNAAEHVSSVTIAMKNKIDFAICISIGSSTQITLFVTSLLVILGWIIGYPMLLFFLPFEPVCLFIAVILLNYLVQDKYR